MVVAYIGVQVFFDVTTTQKSFISTTVALGMDGLGVAVYCKIIALTGFDVNSGPMVRQESLSRFDEEYLAIEDGISALTLKML